MPIERVSRVSDLASRFAENTAARDVVKFWKLMAAGDFENPPLQALARELGPQSDRFFKIKSAVDAIAISGAGAPLASYQRLGDPFMALVRRKTILGQLQTLPAVANTQIPIVTSEPRAAWVREGYPIPATVLEVDLAALDVTKLGAILATSAEWLRATGDPSLSLFESHLRTAIQRMEDETLLDDQAAVPLERPQGLRYNLSPVGSGSPNEIDDALIALWDACRGGEPLSPTFICAPRGALFLATVRGSDGALSFPDASPLGGRLLGVPLITSTAADANLFLVDASAIAVWDDGVVIESTGTAALQMSDAPSPGATTAVSMWNTDMRAIKITRFVNWAVGADDAVAFTVLPI